VEAEKIYHGNATGKEYTRYNNNFITWHKERYGGKRELEEHIREYVGLQAGDTKVLVAALKFRFTYCEKRDIDFSRLRKNSAAKRPHKCLTQE
jgi:hypothetical protein